MNFVRLRCNIFTYIWWNVSLSMDRLLHTLSLKILNPKLLCTLLTVFLAYRYGWKCAERRVMLEFWILVYILEMSLWFDWFHWYWRGLAVGVTFRWMYNHVWHNTEDQATFFMIILYLQLSEKLLGDWQRNEW